MLQTDVYIFFRQIYKMWVDCGLYPELSVEDVKDEVFDMAQPQHPLHITIQDLQVTIAVVLLGLLWRMPFLCSWVLVFLGSSCCMHACMPLTMHPFADYDTPHSIEQPTARNR